MVHRFDVARKPVASEDAGHWYEIVIHKCPSCRSLLRLVERKQPPPKYFSERRRRKPMVS
jgi:hypothetical protein